MWVQHQITLPPVPRGFHLMTGNIYSGVPEILETEVGLLHLLLQHTSASLTLMRMHRHLSGGTLVHGLITTCPKMLLTGPTPRKVRMICRHTSKAHCSASHLLYQFALDSSLSASGRESTSVSIAITAAHGKFSPLCGARLAFLGEVRSRTNHLIVAGLYR